MKLSQLITSALLCAAALPAAVAAPVNQINAATLVSTDVADFTGTPGSPAGTNYDDVLALGNISFAERFVGQVLSSVGDFDVLSGNATGPLSLATGAAGRNLAVLGTGGSNVLAGLGPVGYPDFSAMGEGAIAALFADDQSEFGFDVAGSNGGSATLNFFGRNGSLISTLVLGGLSDGAYAFRRDGGLQDIAGFSIHTDDDGGIGIDNVRYTVVGGGTVPEPGSLALVGAALIGAAFARRRKA